MSSGLREHSCQLTTACLSSRPRRQQRRPWATASALSTPTTPAGPRRRCPACLSCSYRRLWAASRPWRSPCLSAASAPGRRPTPWVYPTCRRTDPACSHTSTSPLSLGWYPHPCRVRLMWPARLSSVVPRTVTSGEGQASPRCGAKRWSTQYPWVSPSDESQREVLFFHSQRDLLHLVLIHPEMVHRETTNQDTGAEQCTWHFSLKSRTRRKTKPIYPACWLSWSTGLVLF